MHHHPPYFTGWYFGLFSPCIMVVPHWRFYFFITEWAPGMSGLLVLTLFKPPKHVIKISKQRLCISWIDYLYFIKYLFCIFCLCKFLYLDLSLKVVSEPVHHKMKNPNDVQIKTWFFICLLTSSPHVNHHKQKIV